MRISFELGSMFQLLNELQKLETPDQELMIWKESPGIIVVSQPGNTVELQLKVDDHTRFEIVPRQYDGGGDRRSHVVALDEDIQLLAQRVMQFLKDPSNPF